MVIEKESQMKRKEIDGMRTRRRRIRRGIREEKATLKCLLQRKVSVIVNVLLYCK